MTLQYGDGKTPETLTFKNDQYVYDTHGNKVSYRFESDDDTMPKFEAGWTLKEGIYKVVVLCNDEPVETDSTYTVNVVKPGDLPALHVGNDNAVESKTVRYNWYKFIAPKTITYLISPLGDFTIIKETEDGTEPAYYDYVSNGIYKIPMEKDIVYYIGLRGAVGSDDEEDEVNHWNLAVEEQLEVSSIVFSEKSLEFVKGLDDANAYTETGTLTVNYKNGQSEQVKVYLGQSAYDRYGNWITPKVTDSNGSEITEWYDDFGDAIELPEGSYKLTYICDKVTSAEIILKLLYLERVLQPGMLSK